VAVTAAAILVLSGCAQQEPGIHGSGTIEADQVTVAARATGELLEVTVSEGQRVEAGQRLARVDPTAVELELAQAEKRSAAAQAQLDLVLAGPTEEDVEQARAAAAEAREAVKLARKSLERTEELHEANSATLSELDRATAEYEQAKARLNAAQARVRKLEAMPRPEEVRAARAQLEEAEAAEARISHRLEQTEITAPRSGTIQTRMHQAGEWVSAGTPLFRLADLSTVELTVYVPEPSLSQIRLGQEAAVSADGMPERRFTGTVTHIAEQAEFTPKNVQTEEARAQLVYAVEISLENEAGVFKIGMPAEAELAPSGAASGRSARLGE
jgi:HlyD family secretion protein